MRFPTSILALFVACVLPVRADQTLFDFDAIPRNADLVGQQGWVVNDRTDVYSAIISNVVINIDSPNTSSRALNYGDASASTLPPSGSSVMYSHAAQGPVGEATVGFDFLIDDSYRVGFENRDVFGFSLSGPAGPVLAVEFVPTQAASPALSTRGDGQWAIHCRVGGGLRQALPMDLPGGTGASPKTVFEARRHDFLATLRPNPVNPALTDLSVTVRNIAGTGSVAIVGTVTLALDPSTPVHAFHLDWRMLEGNTRFGSNSLWLDNLSGPFRDGKVPTTVALAGLSQTYDGTAKPVAATTVPEGLAVAFTYDGSPTAPVNAGSYAVVATIDDNAYEGSATGALVIAKAAQRLTFDPIPDQRLGGSPVTLSASSDRGLAVRYVVVSGPAVLSGATLNVTGTGPVVVRAEQAGDANHHPAEPVERSFAVAPASYEDWAMAVFGEAVAAVGGPLQDADGDGQVNRAEWLAATDPKDGADRFEARVGVDGAGAIHVRWLARQGVAYRVCSSADLAIWTELAGSRRDGAGTVVEVTDPAGPVGGGAPRRWYRVEALQP